MVKLMMDNRRVFGPNASGMDVTGSGGPLRSSLDHLLLKPYHLRGNTHGICIDADVCF